MAIELTVDNLTDYLGQEIGVTDWMTVDQEQINRFADATLDHQWIHIDPERAAKESPFGTTIAHGFYTLSLLPYLIEKYEMFPKGVMMVVNYGADKIRFINPVKVNARIRLKATLLEVTEKGSHRKLIKMKNEMEIEGEEKPAMVAEMLSMIIG